MSAIVGGPYEDVPLRRILQKLDRPVLSEDGVVTAFRDGEVTLRSSRREDGFTMSSQDAGYQGVEPGDFVVHGLDAFAGAVGVSDARGKCSPVYHVCRPVAGADPRYVAWSLRVLSNAGYLELQAGNVRQRSVDFRNWQTFASIKVPLPRPSDQRAIADYLEAETASIESLIAARRQQIELIELRIEGLLSEVLDPMVRRHGEVPLKSVAELRFSNVDKKTAEGEAPVLLCNYTDVYYNRRITQALPFMTATASTDQIRRLTLRVGDVLFTKDSETAEDMGMPARVTEDLPSVVLGYHLGLARPTKVDSAFLYWVLRSRRCRDAFSLAASGVTRFGLRQDAVGRIPVPRASASTAALAVARVETEVARGEAQVMLMGRQIDLNRERRQALITAAVTGQLEIPGLAA